MEVVELYHIVPISFATVLTVHALTRPVLPHHRIAKNPKHMRESPLQCRPGASLACIHPCNL